MLVCPECSSQKNLENQNNKNFFGGSFRDHVKRVKRVKNGGN